MSDKSQLIILTAVGPRDRPGIIASLTRTVFDAGGNLDDTTMTRLHGAFATMIAARIDPGALTNLRHQLNNLATDLELTITVEMLNEETQAAWEHRCGPDHIVSVYGADHPGIVHHFAALFEKLGANVTDLETRLTGETDKPIYVMMVETAGGDWELLPHELSELGRSLGVDVSFSEINQETL